MPQTYSSGVPARGCEVSLISLERCSRPATVASEENEGSSMIGRFRRPHKRTIGREPQKNYLWSREGSLFGTETSRSASLTVCEVAEVSIEDPSSSLAEPRKLSFKACNRFSIVHTPHRHLSLAIVDVVSDPITYYPSSPVFRLFAQSRAAHLTPQHWLLCHLG
jgi:hypothetical protein